MAKELSRRQVFAQGLLAAAGRSLPRELLGISRSRDSRQPSWCLAVEPRRLAALLFRAVQSRPISRLLVQAVAQQDDYMKRIRRNGGARDLLAPEGIAVLWGQKDRNLIRQLGLPDCGPDEFISYKPVEPQGIALLREAGHID